MECVENYMMAAHPTQLVEDGTDKVVSVGVKTSIAFIL
jgi:hypothetical protein